MGARDWVGWEEGAGGLGWLGAAEEDGGWRGWSWVGLGRLGEGRDWGNW